MRNFAAATSQPPLSKGGGTAAGRDGGIASRLTAVPKKRPWRRDCSVLKRHFRERLLISRQSPDLLFRPLSQGGLMVAATSLPPLLKGGGTAAGRDGGIASQLTAVPKKRPWQRDCSVLKRHFRERLLIFRQSPSLRLAPQPAPFHKGACSVAATSRPPLLKGG